MDDVNAGYERLADLQVPASLYVFYMSSFPLLSYAVINIHWSYETCNFAG